MVDKALVLENRRGILSSKRKQERQTQPNTNSRPHIIINSSPTRPIFRPIPQSSQPMPRSAGQEFVTPQQQMIPRPNLFRLQTLEIRVLKEPQPFQMQHRIKKTPLASNVDRRVIMLTVAPADKNHPPQLQECLHRQAAMETLPRPKLSRTTLKGE
jgi:hypothetical protein